MSREPLVAAPEALGFGVPRALACGSCFGIVVERRASNQLRVQGLGFSTKRIRRARHQGRGPYILSFLVEDDRIGVAPIALYCVLVL